MNDYTSATYGDRIASVYDEFYGPANVAERVDVLADLASGGTALELGIGTGTYALPLSGRSVEVYGIESSTAIVDQLRAKDGGESMPVTVGDFADVDVRGPSRWSSSSQTPSSCSPLRRTRSGASRMSHPIWMSLEFSLSTPLSPMFRCMKEVNT